MLTRTQMLQISLAGLFSGAALAGAWALGSQPLSEASNVQMLLIVWGVMAAIGAVLIWYERP